MRSALRKTRRRRGSVTLPPCLWQHSLGCTGGPETGPRSPRPHSPLSTPQRQNLRGGLQACSPPAPQTLPWQRCPRRLTRRSWGARGAAEGSPRHRGGSLWRGEAGWGSPLPRQLLRPPCHGTAPLGGGVGPEEPPGPAGGAVAVTAVWGVRGPRLGSTFWGRGSLLALLPAVLLRGGDVGLKHLVETKTLVLGSSGPPGEPGPGCGAWFVTRSREACAGGAPKPALIAVVCV